MAQPKSTSENAREKAYLSWINSKISAVCPGMYLRALDDEGMRNGTALVELIDAASASRIRIKTPCETETDKVANIREILRRLREMNVPVTTIRAEDVVQGNKSTIMRLLLAISASFMPNHIHDVKHEIRDRHATFGGQTVFHHVANVNPDANMVHRRLFPATYRLQPITIHRLVPAMRPPLLHVVAATVQPVYQYRDRRSQTKSTSLTRKVSSHIYKRSGGCEQSIGETREWGRGRQRKQRSCENLVLSEEDSNPIRASKSMSMLHGKTFVSKLVIPRLRNVRSISLMGRNGLNTHHQRSASTVQNGGSYDSGGYVNHGFSDTQAPPPHPAQMAQFRTELAGVRSELLQLHDVLMASNSAESGITQTVSDYAISSSTQVINESRNVDSSRQTTFSITDDKLLKSTTNSTENLNRLLTVRKEAMDACLADNAELRQTVGELTASLKQLQLENENLRQRLGAPDGVSNGVGGGGGDASAAKGPRTWSFSSESIPNTPCSPIEIGTRQNNYRVINGEPYTTLS